MEMDRSQRALVNIVAFKRNVYRQVIADLENI